MSSAGGFTKATYQSHIAVSSKEDVSINREVWKNNSIDPDLVIPSGIKYPNGKELVTATTNRELMAAGKAPFVLIKSDNGDFSYQQIELHHTTGEETQRGSSFFRGKTMDGTIAELPAEVHDKFSKAIHFPKKSGESFRVDVETGMKSFDEKKYKAFREQYWKDRLKDFDQ